MKLIHVANVNTNIYNYWELDMVIFVEILTFFWMICMRYSEPSYLEEDIPKHFIWKKIFWDILLYLFLFLFFSNSEYSKLFLQYFAPFLRHMVFSLSLSEVRMRIKAFSHGLTALCHASLSIFSFFTWTCTMIWEGKPQAQVSSSIRVQICPFHSGFRILSYRVIVNDKQ